MPIPDFDYNDVLPPHTGNPTLRGDLSPYYCSSLDLCQRFATSKERIEILKKFIAFRGTITKLGVVRGFQWIGGSFLQNIENQESRAPKDLDIVTFFGDLTIEEQMEIVRQFPDFASFVESKKNFLLDHYPVDYCYDPDITVEQARYWVQLFSHTRLGVWKGMLRVVLNSPDDDQEALNYLNSINL